MKCSREVRKRLNELLRHDCPGIVLIVPSKANRYWLLGSPRMSKKAKQRSTVVDHFESGRTCDEGVFRFGMTGRWGVNVLLIGLKSWKKKSISRSIRFLDWQDGAAVAGTGTGND